MQIVVSQNDARMISEADGGCKHRRKLDKVASRYPQNRNGEQQHKSKHAALTTDQPGLRGMGPRRMFKHGGESYIVSECSRVAQFEYKRKT